VWLLTRSDIATRAIASSWGHYLATMAGDIIQQQWRAALQIFYSTISRIFNRLLYVQEKEKKKEQDREKKKEL
jgi:hypothetical protein